MRKLGLAIFGIGTLMMSGCSASAELAGSTWSPAKAPGTYVEFQPGRVVSGNGGCHRFTGTYEMTDTSLSFGPLAATRMACVGEAMTLEVEFFNALSSTAAYSMHAESSEMILKSETGDELMRLVRRNPQ